MIAMVASGFYLGIARDTFSRFNKYWSSNVLLLYVMEISFWITQAFILFYVLFLVNAGEIRVYIVAACLLGFAAYQALAAKAYQWLLEEIIKIIAAIYRFISSLLHRMLVKPVIAIIQLVTACLFFILKLIKSMLLFCLKILFFPIIWTFKLCYRLLPKKLKKYLHKLAGFYSRIENMYNKVKNNITTKRRK